MKKNAPKKESPITVVVDCGNFSTKYCYELNDRIGMGTFPSIIHQYVELDVQEDMQRIQYEKLDCYIGEGVKNFYFGKKESSMYYGNTKKGHHEGLIRLVTALYKIYEETTINEFNLILTSPFSSVKLDKEYFTEKIGGMNTAQVDGEQFAFCVNHIFVVSEGQGAIHFFDQEECKNCIVVDAGSKTVNTLNFVGGAVRKANCHTIVGGTLDTSKFDLATQVIKNYAQIGYDFPIICTGGKAQEMSQEFTDLGYTAVKYVELENSPSYFANALGILQKYKDDIEKTIDEMGKIDEQEN